MEKKKLAKWSRLIMLFSILAYVTFESYQHQVLGGGKAPSVHALCPYGALESLYNLLFMGSFIQKIYSGTVVLLIVTLVITLLFRKSFCGLLCPFGALQEFFARLGQKLLRKRLVMPAIVDRPLRYLKYLVLLLTIVMAWLYGSLWMAPYDPYSAYSHLTNAAADLAENPLAIVGYVILLITVVGSFLYDRFFCKYLCPMGAFYGIIGKISLTKVERNNELCTHCQLCNRACPLNIKVEQTEKVTSMECINCNECVLACPHQGALEVKTAQVRFSPISTLVLVVGIFFGSILLADSTGYFEVLPAKLAAGQTIPVSEVKGYFTIQETAKAIGVALPETYKLLGIPSQLPATTKMKEIYQLAPGYDFEAAKEKAAGSTNPDAVDSTVGADRTAISSKTEVARNLPGKGVDISQLRGSMTIREAAARVNLELREFYQLMKIPETVPAQTILKEVGNVVPGYDFHQIQAEISN